MSDVDVMDPSYAAARAMHALWLAHKQLCAQYEQRGFDPKQASREALADICDEILPRGNQLDSERADSLIDALLGLLDEMRTQEGQPRERGCAWPVPQVPHLP